MRHSTANDTGKVGGIIFDNKVIGLNGQPMENGRADNFTISQSTGVHLTGGPAQNVGMSSMKTLFQNQAQGGTADRKSGKSFRKDFSTKVVHFPFLNNEQMLADNQSQNKSLRMVTAAGSL